jgi:hypothetical protein
MQPDSISILLIHLTVNTGHFASLTISDVTLPNTKLFSQLSCIRLLHYLEYWLSNVDINTSLLCITVLYLEQFWKKISAISVT